MSRDITIPGVEIDPRSRVSARLMLNLTAAGLCGTGVSWEDDRVDEAMVRTVEELLRDAQWLHAGDQDQGEAEVLVDAVAGALTDEVYAELRRIVLEI